MAGPKGCFKSCLLGCGGLIVLLVVLGAIMAGLAWRSLDKGRQVSGNLHLGADTTAVATGETMAADEPMAARAVRLTTTRGGKVHLALGEGEFRVSAAAPGEGLHATAEFNTEVHHLSEQFAVLPDSTWEYRLECRQTMPGLQALFRNLLGGKSDTKVHVYLPPEVPIELVMQAERGGCEADLGGLWLRTGDLQFRQGGIQIGFSSPLREPMDSLRLNARMGGVTADRIGNASPRALDVDCAMGGANIDLRGAWRGDCDARVAIRMGGMNLRVPADMRVEGDGVPPPKLSESEIEMPGPVLRLKIEKSMGEVEVRR
jgi:hypothetical protein